MSIGNGIIKGSVGNGAIESAEFSVTDYITLSSTEMYAVLVSRHKEIFRTNTFKSGKLYAVIFFQKFGTFAIIHNKIPDMDHSNLCTQADKTAVSTPIHTLNSVAIKMQTDQFDILIIVTR